MSHGDPTADGPAPEGRASAERKPRAFMLDVQCGFPAERLKLIGVTGTNGKTSVCHYTTQIPFDDVAVIQELLAIPIAHRPSAEPRLTPGPS